MYPTGPTHVIRVDKGCHQFIPHAEAHKDP